MTFREFCAWAAFWAGEVAGLLGFMVAGYLLLVGAGVL
jgi:hypothetical protein